ncbi:MAG: STAS domain-containing protein [Planctomycetota bacterium]|jgi:anti-anti-sigma factor
MAMVEELLAMDVRRQGDAVVVCPTVRRPEYDIKDWERAVEWALDEGAARLVFDCGKLDIITSMGLVFFLMTHSRAQAAGLRMFLCGPQPTVARSLDISKLSKILDVRESVEAALSA